MLMQPELARLKWERQSVEQDFSEPVSLAFGCTLVLVRERHRSDN